MGSLTIQTSASKGWLHEKGGFSFDERYYFDPLYRWEQDRAIDQFLAQSFPDHAIYNMESNLVQREFFTPNQVLVGGIQPNLILGACLGAEFIFPPDKDPDILTKPLEDIETADALPTPATLLEHPLIKQLDEQIVSMRRENLDLSMIPPFFWDTSGRATVHGFITTSLKFYGENIYLIVYDDPEFVSALHEWIMDVYIMLIQHFSEVGEMRVSSVHIGECSGTMLRPKHYERFIVPYASKMGRTLGPIRLHSCGHSDHLLDSIGKIDNFRVIDTGSNTSLTAIREKFGSDFQIDLAPPAELLLDGSPREQILLWLDQVLVENENGPLQIGYHLEPGYSLENCLAIHDELHNRGLVKKGR